MLGQGEHLLLQQSSQGSWVQAQLHPAGICLSHPVLCSFSAWLIPAELGMLKKAPPEQPFSWTGLLALWPGWGGSPARDGVIDTGATENTAEIVHTNVI